MYALTIPRQDGDTINIFIRGHDAIDNYIHDYIQVHVDSTPPDLLDISLCKDGYCGLAVHNSKDISKMQ